jgi:peptidoglycan/LPS O-acetylase OafA/YrhL
MGAHGCYFRFAMTTTVSGISEGEELAQNSLAAPIKAHADSDRLPSPSLPRVPWLDGLRGIGILSVILVHCALATRASGTRTVDRLFGMTVDNFGPIGMELFFAISGFLITSILERTRAADRPIRTFYFRRILRILPLYYGFLLLVLFSFSHLPPVMVGQRHDMVWYFTFLTNFFLGFHGDNAAGTFFPHFWSLAVEEQFYIFWPLVLLWQPVRLNEKTCLVLIGFSLAFRSVVAFGTNFHFFGYPFVQTTGMNFSAYFLTPGRLDGLLAGSLVALLGARRPAFLGRVVKPAMAWSGVAGVVLILACVEVQRLGRQSLSEAVWLIVLPFTASIFFAALIGWIATNPPERNPKWLAGKNLASVARYSYGMYAFHMPIIILLLYRKFAYDRVEIRGYGLPYTLYFFVVVSGISYLLGYLSWHFFEKRFLLLAPRYRYRVEAAESI